MLLSVMMIIKNDMNYNTLIVCDCSNSSQRLYSIITVELKTSRRLQAWHVHTKENGNLFVGES